MHEPPIHGAQRLTAKLGPACLSERQYRDLVIPSKAQLIGNELVDEYRLMIQPAALGAGLPLFKDLAVPLHLELIEATTYATGLAIHVYRPRSSPAAQPLDPDQGEQSG